MLLPREILIDLGNDLADRSSVRIECPWCEAKEKSFVLTREGYQLKYICHRASCGSKGIIILNSTLAADNTKTGYREKKNEFLRALKPIPMAVGKDLDYRYDLDLFLTQTVGWKWAPDEDEGKGRLYMPIKAIGDKMIGCTLRSLHKNVVPKSRIYLENPNEPLLSWYYNNSTSALDAVVIVEDQLSALKVAQLCKRGVALLGCNLDTLKANVIAGICKNLKATPVLWLDPDAFDKALAFRRKLEPILPSIAVIKSESDPKDTSKEDIEKLLKEVLPK